MAEEGKEIPHQLTREDDSEEEKIMSVPKTANESQGDCEIISKEDELAVSVLSEEAASQIKAKEDKEITPQETADSALSSTDHETTNSHVEEVEQTIEKDDSEEMKIMSVPKPANESQDDCEKISKEDELAVSEGDSEEKKIMFVPENTVESPGDIEKKSFMEDELAVSVLSEEAASQIKAKEDREIPLQELADSALSSTDNETTNSHVEEVEQTIENAREESEVVSLQDTADGGSEHKKKAITRESSPDDGNAQKKESSSPSPSVIESNNDYKKKSSKNNGREISGEDQTGLYKTPETTITLTQKKREEELKTKLNEESPSSGGIEDIVTAVKMEGGREIKMTKLDKQVRPREEVTTIGAISQDPTVLSVPEAAESPGGGRKYFVAVVVVLFIAILVQHIQPESPPQVSSMRHVEIFRRLMDKVKTRFPHQRDELWNRSRIHLQRHLQTAQPTEPVSVILTAGLRAQRTLRCLAQSLASAFSSALNASVLLIDGASVARQDSDQVKLDIDSQLQGAFEGNTPVAVIHRLEELPPGSTLIFYRYCDHENAAYKKTFLLFTVLLEEEEEIPAKIHLSAVEEMVDDHLQKKFLSHDQPVSFDRMDRDKYGGLWSRISHLILPVASEDKIEHGGCERT